MQKLGFGRRLLAMLLALTMVVSLVPNVFRSAKAAVGDIYPDREPTGLSSDGINTKDTISWPIKIYDYLNDGMLFEYSSAQDTTIWPHTGGSYGGGKTMPMIGNHIGEDYTSISGYYQNNYAYSSTYGYSIPQYSTPKHSFRYWGDKSAFSVDYDSDATEVKRSINQPVTWVSPMSLHLKYDHSTNTDGTFTKSYGWVSNFARDRETYYTGNQVRYMVIVYKTNDVYTQHNIRPFWAVSDSSYSTDYSAWNGSIDISDLTDYFGRATGSGNKTGLLAAAEVGIPKSTSWTYKVVDMKTDYNGSYGIASNWTNSWSGGSYDLSTDARVAGIGMSYPLCGEGEEMDISHIAYFSSAEEAENFGQSAVEFDNNPGEYIGYTMSMSHSTTGGGSASATEPVPDNYGTYMWSFTNTGNAAWSSSTFTEWSSSTYALTTVARNDFSSGGFSYVNVSNTDTDNPDMAYIWKSSSYITTDANTSNYQIRYITVVYRTHGISNPKLGFWLEDYPYSNCIVGKNAQYRIDITASEDQWQYVTYDLELLKSKWNLSFDGKVETFNRIGIMFPGFVSGQSMDIAYIDYRQTQAQSDNFGKAAVAYLNSFTASGADTVKTSVSRSSAVKTTYNMGSNQAFTMLYACTGGGWLADGNTGGANTKSNGYFSYQVGYNYMYDKTTSQSNTDRNTAKSNGYRVSDSIFLLNTYSSCTKYLSNYYNASYAIQAVKDAAVNNLNGVTFDVTLDYDDDGDAYYFADNKRFDMSQLDLGYTLYNTMKDSGVMTAGLLQSGMATYKGMDGQEHRIMQYKDDTITYIAQLLNQTLVIPSRDGNGYNYNYVKGTASPLYYEDWDGDGKLDIVDEDLDNDGHLDVDEYQDGKGILYSEDFDRDGHLDVFEDLNKNGILDYSEDLDNDGRLDAWEDLDYDGLIDPGEDVDGDGKLDVGEDLDYDGNLDVYEDLNHNGVLDDGEDVDGDGKLDLFDEDVNGNNKLDWYTEDRNYNGVLDEGEDLNGNGKLDRGEDLNGNGKLDLSEDVDGDGKLDCGEDKNCNGVLDEGEDLNNNGALDLYEDLNNNGILDLSDDMDGDGKLDKQNEDVDGDGNLDINEKAHLGDGDDVLDRRDLASALRERLGIVFTDANWTATTQAAAQNQPNKAALGSYANTAKKFNGEDFNNNGKLDEGEDLNGNGKLDVGMNLLIGPYLKCAPYIETFYDAAYYLLHNIFVPGSYNHVETDYNYLVMSKGYVTAENKYAYVFDAGFTYADGTSATVYDDVQKTISQAVADKKHHIVYMGDNTTTLHPFLPVNDSKDVAGAAGSEFKATGTPYIREDGAASVTTGGATYADRNYNYVMAANGEFVFHRGDDLFFDFEGDDDVYMFINGELVLDIGAAHSITKVGFNMNDYVEAAEKALDFLIPYGYKPAMSDAAFLELFTAAKLTNYTFDANGNITSSKEVTNPFLNKYTDAQIREFLRQHRLYLVDGNSYNIDFYYMERHGWGANMRIATNIVMTDPSVVTDKTAYQGTDVNGQPQEIEYGGLIDDSQPVNYSFAMTNKGNTKLYNLSFADENIGVDLSAANGLQVFGKATTTKFTVTSQTTLAITGLNGIFDLNGQNYNIRADGTITWTEDDQTKKAYSITIPYDAQDASKNDYTLTLYQYDSSMLFKDVEVQITLGSGTTGYTPTKDAYGNYYLQLGSVNTVEVMGIRVTDERGGRLDPSDLTITVDGYASPEDYAAYKEAYDQYLEDKAADPTIGDFVDRWKIKTITVTVSDNAELKAFLSTLQDPKKQTSEGEGVPEGKSALYYGAGLWQNGTVTVSGMWYTLSEDEQADKVFNNTVYTKAYKSLNSDDPCKGQASHRVYSPGEPMYYQWANKPVFLDVNRFWTDVVAASQAADNTMQEQADAIINLNGNNGAGVDYLSLAIVDRNGGKVSVSNNYYNNGKWGTLPGSERTAPDGYRTIYFKQIYDWDNVYAYYWSDSDKQMVSWPGTKMSFTKTGDDNKTIYQLDIPSNARYIIFNDGGGTQTGDITVPIVDYDKVSYDTTNRVLNVNFDSPGMHMFYVKVTSSKVSDTALVPLTFYVTYVEDKSVVLDYGLSTEDLNTDGLLFARDELLGSHNTTAIEFMGVTTTQPSYHMTYDAAQKTAGNINRILFESMAGTAGADGSVYYQAEDGKFYMNGNVGSDGAPITYSNSKYSLDRSIWFTPEKFMDQEYNLWLALSVHEKDALKPSATAQEGKVQYHAVAGAGKGTIDIGAEVQMYKKITVIPATVVYYEDDFANITYTAPSGTFERHGAGSGSLTQGVDQEVPYGQDNTYQTSDNAEFSGNVMTTINIADSSDVANFTFSGTGFEIISRTNAFDSAAFYVTVKDANGNVVKRLPIITEFTSAAGACDHTYHNTNGYCTYCGKSVSHSYVDNRCSVCGIQTLEYYLMGYINNYDHDKNSTAYKFEDGKLTATFDSESYLVVHDSNGKEYWTNGYPGNATSAMLYDLNSFTEEQKKNGQNDKLRVPGGVEVTLTLMDNGNGTMALSYTHDVVQHGERTVYFAKGNYEWDEIYIYYWSSADGSMMSWPGDVMKPVEGKDGYYYYKVPSEAEFVIFNKGEGGDGNQTTDQTIPGDNYIYKNGKWYVYGEENNVVEPETQVVYFNNTAGWDTPYAHYWLGSDGTTWPGVAMTYVKDSLYSVEVPVNMTNIVFNKGEGGDGNQTGDLTIPGNNQMYDYANGTWSEYVPEAPTTKTVYFDNRIMNWNGTPNAYYWGAEGANSWPGTPMTLVEGTIYSIELPIDMPNIIFNNGEGGDGNQTTDLTIPGDGYVYDNGWSKYGVEITYQTVYFKNTAGWSKPTAHYWSDLHQNMTARPGTAMTLVEGDIYSVQVRTDAQYIIFSNNGSNQTSNLTLEAGKPCYASGTWYTYPMPELTRPIYYANTKGWDNVYVYYWSNGNKNMVNWPGQAMTYEQSIYFSSVVPVDATYVMFNDGTLTTKLTLGTGDLYSDGIWSNYLSGTGKTIYFKNTENWSNPSVYVKAIFGEMVSLTKLTKDFYGCRIPTDTDVTVFFANDALEVMDIPATDNMYVLNRGWYASDIEIPAAADGMKNIVFFDNGSWGQAYVFWSCLNMADMVQMTAVAGKPGYYICQIPEYAEEIGFARDMMDGSTVPVAKNLYQKGHYLGDWSALNGSIIYYENTNNLVQPHVYYWAENNTGLSTWSGMPMTHLEGDIWYYQLPATAKYVMFSSGNATQKTTLADEENLFEDNGWHTFVSGDAKEIHQIPIIRVTDLPYGKYTITITGMPTYMDNTDWDYISELMIQISDGNTAAEKLADDGYGEEKIQKLNADAKTAEEAVTTFENGVTGPDWELIHTLKNEGSSTEEIYAQYPDVDWAKYDELWATAQSLRIEAERVNGLSAAVTKGQTANKTLADYKAQMTKPTYLYIDGLRIYQPYAQTITNGDGTITYIPGTSNHYNENEDGATFVELRDLILNGSASVATYDLGTTIYNGNMSWSENRNGYMPNPTGGTTAYTKNQVSGINDYMVVGPNNEVYVNGNVRKEAVVFYVKEKAGQQDRTLQIAARAVNDTLFLSGKASDLQATLYQGMMLTAPDGSTSFGWSAIDIIESGTEQYYSIDYTKCPYDSATGTYQVALYVRNGMVSFTNVKYKGLEFPESKLGNATVLYYDELGRLITPVYMINGTSGGETMEPVFFEGNGSVTMEFKNEAKIYVSRKVGGVTVPFYANSDVGGTTGGVYLYDEDTYSGVITIPANSEVTFSVLDYGNGSISLNWSSQEITTENVTPASENPGLNMAAISLQMASETFIGEVVPLPEQTLKAPELTMNGASLSFDDEIRYNIYFNASDVDDVVEMGLITFADRLADGTIADAVDMIAGAVTDGNEYMVHTNGIPAKNMGDTVYFKVYAKLSDGSYVYSDVAGYNAVVYAQSILANSQSESMKALVVSMLNYGAAAQQYFGYRTDALMNAGLTAEQQALVSAYDQSMISGVEAADSSKLGDFAKTEEGFGKLSASVSFDGAFAINYYMTTTKAVEGDVTMYFWTASDYANASELTAENATGSVTMTAGAEYWASVCDIAAKEIDDTVYVAAVYTSEGETYCSGVRAYSLGQYCKTKAADEAAAVQDFAAATAVYGYYAKNHFAN